MAVTLLSVHGIARGCQELRIVQSELHHRAEHISAAAGASRLL